MMTWTGKWNAPINAFPAFADSTRVATVNSRTLTAVTFSGLLRRR
ncbi:hypothetical protein NG819_03525 [Pseudarthrobacter sp. Fe7]|nr:hypothetical protein NG819_03525 [Pseudarthrobacter sp. Fe7]